MTKLDEVNADLKEHFSLIKELEKLDTSYYGDDEPMAEDSEYDLKKINLKKLVLTFIDKVKELNLSKSETSTIYKYIQKELKSSIYLGFYEKLNSLENDAPALFDFIVENRAAGSVKRGFSSSSHSVAMFSLANAFDNEDIKSFIASIFRYLKLDEDDQVDFILEPKVDGLSLSLRYENGVLVKALTRGDGKTGEDVTKNALVIKDIPKEINTNLEVLEVRGEVFIKKDDFLTINKKREELGQKLFANPRNLAAGSIRQLDSEVTKERPLMFSPWGLGEVKGKEEDALEIKDNLFKTFNKLKDLGFRTSEYNKLAKNIDEIITYYNYIEANRYKIAFDIDGLVLKVNSFLLQKRLGETQKDPRWAIAYKFSPKNALTRLNKITLQVGRTGIITPVANLEPVNIGGAIITRASLYNSDELERKDIREGDTVLVVRAGDVIPKVMEVKKELRDEGSKVFIMPGICPVCNQKLYKDEGSVATKCVNKDCSGILIEKLKYFVSKDALDIDGLGEKTIELFFNKGFIKYNYDVFNLPNKYEELIALEGFSHLSVQNLIASIEAAKTIDLEKFIYSLGINKIGVKTAKILAKFFTSSTNLLKRLELEKDKVLEELNNIDGLGSLIIKEIETFFTEDLEDTKKLLTFLNVKDFVDVTLNEGAYFYKKILVFTGTLATISRKEAKIIAEKNGAIVTENVSKSTDFVVSGQASGTKLKKAQELNIKILTEEDFLSLSSK